MIGYFKEILLVFIFITLVIDIYFNIKIAKKIEKKLDAIGNMARCFEEVFQEDHMAYLLADIKTKFNKDLMVSDGEAVRVDKEF